MQKTERQDQYADETAREWEKICDLFEDYYGEDIFKTWLGKCKLETVMCDVAYINAPTRFIKERIETEYNTMLKRLWQRVNVDVTDIKITVGCRTKAENATPHTAQIIQLPLWAEAARGTPNAILRGALFAAINPNKRR